MIELFISDSRGPAAEAALVLEAVGIDNELDQHPRGWCVRVAEESLGDAHRQLHTYWEENKPPTVKPVSPHIVDSGWSGVLGYLLVIWCIPALEFYTQADWREVGRLDAVGVTSGELWRVVTALTLHADLSHIASNSLFGCLFGLFAGRYLGSGLGWLMILLCGCAGNLVNAFVQPGAFFSIGASTATFAALGLVPAYGWRKGYFRGRGAARGFAPVFGAIAMLAFTGFGAENVDALAHIFGFAAGIGMGLLLTRWPIHELSTADQQRAGIAAIIIVVAGWLFAFSSGAKP